MKRQGSRLMSMLMALVMVLALMPVRSSAALIPRAGFRLVNGSESGIWKEDLLNLTPYSVGVDFVPIDGPAESGYTPSIAEWRRGDDFLTARVMSPNEAFETGYVYWVVVRLTPDPGVRLGDTDWCTLKEADDRDLGYFNGNFREIPFKIDFKNLTRVNAWVTAGSIDSFEGHTVRDLRVSYLSRSLYKVKAVSVRDQLGNVLPPETPLTSGGSYEMWFRATAAPGCMFQQNATVCTVDGQPAEVAHNAGEVIEFVCDISDPKDQVMLDRVECEVTPPLDGERPDYTVTVPAGAGYTAVMINWFAGETAETGRFMEPDETFRAGIAYWPVIHFLPKPGYTVAQGLTEARINQTFCSENTVLTTSNGAVELRASLPMMQPYMDFFVLAQPEGSTRVTNAGGVECSAFYLEETVILNSNNPDPANQEFVRWEVVEPAGLVIRDAGLENGASFLMPNTNVNVRAVYRDKNAPRFTDVKPGDWFDKFVDWAVEHKITAGTSTNPPRFSPHETCIKSQILTFIWNSQGQPAPTIANPFTDVKETDWFYRPALWAYEKGLVEGSLFNGNEPCTRADTVVYLWKFAGKPDASDTGFNDVDYTADYAKAVNWAVFSRVTAGNGAGGFSPMEICSRAQIVTFIYNYFQNVVNGPA